MTGWKDGRLTQAVFKNLSNPEGRCTIHYGDVTRVMKVPLGAEAVVGNKDFAFLTNPFTCQEKK